MEKKPLQSKPQRLLKNEGWTPYVRYQKETDTWITKAIKEERGDSEEMEETMDQTASKIRILMDRKQLDIMARLVAYLYHDKKDDYTEIASDLRIEHIYKDLRSIDEWLDIQYKQLERQEKSDKRINQLDKEIIDEQSEQKKGKYI